MWGRKINVVELLKIKGNYILKKFPGTIKDSKGEPFTKESAIEYGKQIRGNCVYLIEGKKTLIHS